MLENEIKKLTAAVDALNATMSAQTPGVTEPPPIIPRDAPAPTQQAPAVPQPTHTPQSAPGTVSAPATQPAPTPQTITISADEIKVKASRLAQLLGPQAAQISAHLQTLGANRLSELPPGSYADFNTWLDQQLAGR